MIKLTSLYKNSMYSLFISVWIYSILIKYAFNLYYVRVWTKHIFKSKIQLLLNNQDLIQWSQF